jgi:hypothetical protein
MILLVVHGWSTECGACGYGAGGWASARNPALEGKPILGPDSTICHGCDETFTHVSTLGSTPAPIADLGQEAA